MQTMFIEQPEKLRNKESYKTCLSRIEEQDFDGIAVDGVKNYCILNDLQFYHMLENTSVDVMHDVNEGVVPHFVMFFFNYMVSKRILNLATIQIMARDFNYGTLETRNKPSFIKMTSHNLGQNASQIVCLMRHLPFIFVQQQENLGAVWSMMVGLLQIMQILYSTAITSSDVQRLEELIKTHLSGLVAHGQNLLFKHHMLTHYPNVIRRTGPVIHGSMMRYESKHKEFTSRARTTNNYINIAKTLAYHSQQKLCLAGNVRDDIKTSKTFEHIKKCNEREKCLGLLDDRNIDEIVVLDFLIFNSYEYRKGLIILNDQNVFIINNILHDRDQNNFLLVCEPMKVCEFNISLNSFEIEETQTNNIVFDIKSLENKETFNKIVTNGKMYLFARTLSFSHLNLSH